MLPRPSPPYRAQQLITELYVTVSSTIPGAIESLLPPSPFPTEGNVVALPPPSLVGEGRRECRMSSTLHGALNSPSNAAGWDQAFSTALYDTTFRNPSPLLPPPPLILRHSSTRVHSATPPALSPN